VGLYKTTENFINEAKFIHNNKYNYSLVNYIDSQIKIIIICPTHGEFEQSPNSHLSGHGCSLCTQSIGENKIENFLFSKNIEYVYQKIFNDCKHKRKLRFDFYLPKHKICIEYDGIQHFKPIEYFGGIKYLDSQQINDKIKNDFCFKENINLIRIKYNEDIKNKLKVFI
jgi:very-short-patch-repair endonuclease